MPIIVGSTILKKSVKIYGNVAALAHSARTAIKLLMEGARLFGYHIPVIIKSKCF
jgi:hypothetical protein